MTAPKRRRTYKPAIADKVSGLLAHADGGVCFFCDGNIIKGQRIVNTRRGWVHADCHSGAHQ